MTAGVMIYKDKRIGVDDVERGYRDGRAGWYAVPDLDNPLLRVEMFYPADMFTFEQGGTSWIAAVSNTTDETTKTLDPKPWITTDMGMRGWREFVLFPSKFDPRPEFEQDRSKYDAAIPSEPESGQ